MKASRPWLALVFVLFCLPLFIGLGRHDLGTDEAIYSFGVDRILESGDWLAPKSSPSETDAFLEKPPLKFWLVAAPIRLGLLPHNEFGLRFEDALFGGASFVYIFLIGSLLAGPVCGAVAVLLLFVHGPLLFEHGLRSNNMEAALLLSYCGGIYHFLGWQRSADKRSRRGHALATGLCFVLGFMTKFVAAAFLPLVVGLCALATRSWRRQLIEEWKTWAVVGLVAAALIVPWFIYAQVRFGRLLWDTILGAHVLVRFTGTLDPQHQQPWNFYVLSMYRNFGGAAALVIAGLVTLLVQTVRRRWPEGALVLLWAALPTLSISLSTSKLYHYAYPFLPPLALAGGYLTALFVMLAPVPLRNGLEWVEDRIARVPVLAQLSSRRWIAALLGAVVVLAAAAALSGAVAGRFRFALPGGAVLRSSGIVRPLLVMIAAGVLARRGARVSRVTAMIVVASALPLGAYYSAVQQLPRTVAPLRSASECIQRLQHQPGMQQGLYVNRPESGWWHPLYYYFRRVQPWTQSTGESVETLNRYLYRAGEWRPVLIDEQYYRRFTRAETSGMRAADTSPAMITAYDAIVLLPGPYASCSPEAAVTLTP